MPAGSMCRRRARRVLGRGLIAVLVIAVNAPAVAQVRGGNGANEVRLLRDAQERERAGDLAGAEAILRSILEARPGSLSAILGLERVLRMQGESADLLPWIERLLSDDPTSAIGHQMALRTLSSLNRVDEMVRAAETWMESTPTVETPYREIARVWTARGERERAVGVLERGRDRLGGSALALELGALLAEQGEIERAAVEWEQAIGPEADGLLRVQRRLSALSDGGARVLPVLVDALSAEPTTLPRLRAAATLAAEAGLSERAERVARQVADRLDGRQRESFLVAMARRADSVRLHTVAYWAYHELLESGEADDEDDEEARDGGERLLAIRTRVAELALAVGDTASARQQYRVIENAYEAGSPARRKAAALRVQLTVRETGIDRGLDEFAEFRDEYPDAPELDDLAAGLAEMLLADGDDARAERLVTGVRGPRSEVLRGRIALRRGDVPAARAALTSAATSLRGAEATEAIRLATLLTRLSPEAGRLLGRAMAHMVAGEPHEAIATLSEGARSLPSDESAAVLDFAARLADGEELEFEAERLRRMIIAEYAEATEAPAALLALGRALARRGDGVTEARQLLEQLVLEHPRSALVPQARRELNRLDERIPRS